MKNNQKRFSLNGKWKLYYCKEDAIKEVAFNGTEKSLAMLCKIYASVPGNFELDFIKNGILPKNIFFGSNVLKLREYEDVHLFYVRRFKKKFDSEYLVFDGIDTFADVYLNGKRILSADNMLIEHGVLLSDEKEENELVVHIKPTVIEAKKFPKHDYVRMQHYCEYSAYVRKAPHSFGWDIMPRAISGGLWKDVYLEENRPFNITDVYCYTEKIENNVATLRCSFAVNNIDHDVNYVVKGNCKKSNFTVSGKTENMKAERKIEVPSPELWWPRDYGKQNLYKITIRAFSDNVSPALYEFNFGIRTAKLERTSVIENGNGKFCFFINGKKIFIRGTNWTPLDVFHSRDAKRLKKAFSLLLKINCNGVRCWGGNVYESDKFFDLCDKHGIVVWQDFAMACGLYPQDEIFFNELRTEIESVAKRLRNHPSVLLWAGDNECDINIKYLCDKNPNEVNKATRVIIPETLKKVDPARIYMPSSPYIDERAFMTELPLSEDHTWGDRSYFKGTYYANTKCCFASEMGFAGMPSKKSLKKFISPSQLWPWKDEKGFEGFDPTGKDFLPSLAKDKAKDEWLLHSTAMETKHSVYAYQIPLVAYSARHVFGDENDTLKTFILKSQFVQAEAYKFNIERYRLAKWYKTGLMWWNLIDGWPQISHPPVDYFFNKKPSFKAIRRAQKPLTVAIDEPADGYHNVVICNDLQTDVTVKVKITELISGKTEFIGKFDAKANENTIIGKLPFKNTLAFYKIEFVLKHRKNITHYVNDILDCPFDKYLQLIGKVGIKG